jgi:hypothetical protein
VCFARRIGCLLRSALKASCAIPYVQNVRQPLLKRRPGKDVSAEMVATGVENGFHTNAEASFDCCLSVVPAEEACHMEGHSDSGSVAMSEHGAREYKCSIAKAEHERVCQ